MAEPAWDPASYPRKSRLSRILEKRGLDYAAFLDLSFRDPETFWRWFFEDAELPWPTPFRRVLDLSRGKPWPWWFPGGETNLAWWAVGRRARIHPDRVAVIWEREDGSTVSITYGELDEQVRRLAAGLASLGLEPGDRVGIFLPLNLHAVVALLGVSAAGGVAVPLFSGFGAEAVRIRLEDSGARMLITQGETPRRGRPVPLLEIVRTAVQNLPSLERMVVFDPPPEATDVTPARDVLASPPLETYPWFSADTPFMLIYTSGTTGRPKGTVHVHAGFPVKAAQDMVHLFDVQEGDVITWLTDLGWMMGPWLVLGGLMLGATVLLYDGAPDYPEPHRLFDVWLRHRAGLVGLSPTFVRAIRGRVEDWLRRQDLAPLRAIGSTGEPWTEEAWWWTFEHLGRRKVPILNYSGGTEISGGILGCVVVRPIVPLSFNTAVPGVEADVVDEAGNAVVDEVGYLVVRNVNPGMTRGFWQAPERYLATYWERFPGIWFHGDLARRTRGGFWFILGRADDTLKVAGKRLGPAEMENVVARHPAVREAAVVGVPHPVKGEVPVVFAVLREENPSPTLAEELRQWVAQHMGKALAPHAVHIVPELPKTRNAKVMRRVIRRVYLGQDPGDLSALVNPEALEAIRRLRADQKPT